MMTMINGNLRTQSLVLMAVLTLLAGCQSGPGKVKKTTPALVPNLTFSGFAMNTPLDTLASKLPAKPTLQTDDELVYENAEAEGVRWNRIAYSFSGGKLARVTARQSINNVTDYQALHRTLTKRYGKPAQNLDSLIIWAGRDAELSLQPGNLLFSRR